MKQKDNDVILKKEWYEYYVECSNNLKKIEKILSDDIIINQLHTLVGDDSDIWNEMIDIYHKATIKNPKESKEFIDECIELNKKADITRRNNENK